MSGTNKNRDRNGRVSSLSSNRLDPNYAPPRAVTANVTLTDGSIVKAMLDTGSDCSIIRGKNVPLDVEIYPQSQSELQFLRKLCLYGVTNNQLNIRGTCKMSFTMPNGSKSKPYEFLVVSESNYPVILGIDFLHYVGTQWNLQSMAATWNDDRGEKVQVSGLPLNEEDAKTSRVFAAKKVRFEEPKKLGKIKTKNKLNNKKNSIIKLYLGNRRQGTRFEPRTRVRVEVNLPDERGKVSDEHIYLIQPSRVLSKYKLMMPNQIISGDELNDMRFLKLHFVNSNPYPIRIAPSSQVAELVRLDQDEFSIEEYLDSLKEDRSETDPSLPVIDEGHRPVSKNINSISTNNPSGETKNKFGFDKDDPEHVKELLERISSDQWDLVESEKEEAKKWIVQHSEVFAKDEGNPGICKLPALPIDTGDAKPIRSRPYRTSPEDREAIQKTITRLLNTNVIREVRSEWSFPVLIVKQKDKLRMCVNYIRLNGVTKKDVYPLPPIDEIIANLGGKTYFSSVDLCQGYHQVKIRKEDQVKTTMVTHMGTYAWNTMSFGLTNAPAHFSRCMDVLLAGLHWRCASVFIDDVVVYSNSFKEHLGHLDEVFGRLREFEVKVKPSKCQLFKDELTYLGHQITKEGINPITDKVEAINKIPPPKTLKELRSYIQKCNYYRRFIKDFSKICNPLRVLTKKECQPFKGWKEGSEEHAAFLKLRDVLTSAPVLKHPQHNKPYFIEVDACKEGIGATLMQEHPPEEGTSTKPRKHPVHYASRRLTATERGMDASHAEACGVIWALNHFRHYIAGVNTTVLTDHGPLTWLLNTDHKNTPLSKYAARLQQWSAHVKIVYKPGRYNSGADATSRLAVKMRSDKVKHLDDLIAPDSYVGPEESRFAVSASTTGINPPWDEGKNVVSKDDVLFRLKSAQHDDANTFEIIRILNLDEESDELGEQARQIRKMYEEKDGLLFRTDKRGKHPEGDMRLYVPVSMRKMILEYLHDHRLSAHVGKTKVLRTFRKRFYWPGATKEIEEYVRTCPGCQKYNATKRYKQGRYLPKNIQLPFHTLSIDICGPFPYHKGYRYCLTIVDCFSRWPILLPVKSKSALDVASAIVQFVIYDHGCPRRILTDQGGEFENEILHHICDLLGIEKIKTSPYHPQTNSNAERIHRFIKKAVAILVEGNQQWPSALKDVAFAYRVTAVDGVGYSPFEIIYGREPVLPVDLFTRSDLDMRISVNQYQVPHLESMRSVWKSIAQEQETRLDKLSQSMWDEGNEVNFEVGDFALVYMPPKIEGRGTGKITSNFRGPFKVISISQNTNNYGVMNENTKRCFVVHVSNMIKYHMRNENSNVYDDLESLSDDVSDFDGDLFVKDSQAKIPLENEGIKRNIKTRSQRSKEAVFTSERPAKGKLKKIDENLKLTVAGQSKNSKIYSDSENKNDVGLSNVGIFENEKNLHAVEKNFSVKKTSDINVPHQNTSKQNFENESENDSNEETNLTVKSVSDPLPTWDFLHELEGKVDDPVTDPVEHVQVINSINNQIYVGRSTIPTMPKDKPFGVFARKRIEKGKILGKYKGKMLSQHEYDSKYKNTSAYVVGPLENGCYVDASHIMDSSWTRYINCNGVDEPPNVELIEDNNRLYIVSCRDITTDEELVMEYGSSWVWAATRGSRDFSKKAFAEGPPKVDPDKKVKHDLLNLAEDSFLIYKNQDDPEFWQIGKLMAVDYYEPFCEVQRFGSYQRLKNMTSDKWQFFPMYVDTSDGKSVFTDKAIKSSYESITDLVDARNVLFSDFFLQNNGKIPSKVRKQLCIDLLDIEV